MTYTYDSWGNITEKKIYAYTTATDPGTPTDTKTYTYSTGDWKDQLVSYDGQTIAYQYGRANELIRENNGFTNHKTICDQGAVLRHSLFFHTRNSK